MQNNFREYFFLSFSMREVLINLIDMGFGGIVSKIENITEK